MLRSYVTGIMHFVTEYFIPLPHKSVTLFTYFEQRSKSQCSTLRPFLWNHNLDEPNLRARRRCCRCGRRLQRQTPNVDRTAGLEEPGVRVRDGP